VWKTLRNAFEIPELRRRIFFTLAMLAVFRLGIYVPIPGINLHRWTDFFSSMAGQGAFGGFIGFFDVFAGGALRNFSIFTMSVTPYINAAIIIQMLTAVLPKLKELAREGEEGRKKIEKYTRNLTLLLALVQGFFLTFSIARSGQGLISVNPAIFVALATSTIIAGTMFLLWLGERITDNGIGNGISVLIFAGIVARYPSYFMKAIVGGIGFTGWAFIIVIAVIAVAGIIYIQEGERRIKVQYAKRIVGRKVYGGQSSYIPMRVNQGGVIPIIFASALMMIPTALGKMTGNMFIQTYLAMGSLWYDVIYVLLVFFFTYFYSAITFDVHDVADNMKKYGGFMMGIRPGVPTERYLQKVLTRVTFVGAIFLSAIAILPYVVTGVIHVQIWLGGTSLLIAVGVALDVVQQIEAHLIMRYYDGFMKKGRLRVRR